MPEKIIRDPVHDLIALRTEDATDRLLFQLLNAAEFQRLRRIRQLGMAHMAYPGADHSRYSHSLGVMQTARLMLQRIALDMPLDDSECTVCLVAALLHDLGHGPFSHVFERVTSVKHEKLTYRVILDAESEIHRLLIKHDPKLPEQVVQLLQGKWPRRFLSDVISSQFDADRLDYLLRDNQFTGAHYGTFDLRWLLAAITVDPASQRLVVRPKAISAVEAYLQARYHMYRNVYFHKVVRSSEGMLKLALRRARRLLVQGRLAWPQTDSSVHKALLGQRMSMKEFVDLDDVSLTQCFKLWADSAEDATLARLCKGLLFRKLYKTIDLAGHSNPHAAFVAAAQTVLDAGGDPEYDLFFDQPSDTPYAVDPTNEKGIKVLLPDGKLKDFAEVSPMTEGLNRQLTFNRIHIAEEYRDAAFAVTRFAGA
ncbi:MAG: HD domain-containing protein [Tepidisphaeraceae bacterium]